MSNGIRRSTSDRRSMDRPEPGIQRGSSRQLRALGALAALIRDRRGVIVVMFALMLPILIGFIGLGVEVGLWYKERRDLQAAADAGALAGAYELAEDRASNVGTVAQREAENNGWTSGAGTITIRSSPFNGLFPAAPSAYTADASAVQVLLTRQVSLLFAGYFLGSGNSITINTKAVGKSVAGATTACVLALGSGLAPGNSAISAVGGASISMSGCTVATNSTNSSAISISGGATLTADCVYSSGGVSGTPVTTACSGAKENQPAVSDPYADIPVPTFSACSNPADKYSLTGSSSDTISAGVYCSISSSSSGTLTLNPGTYYLDGGDFKISGSGNVSGTGGVTIVLGDSSGGGNCGNVSITGGGEIDMTAPTSGTYAGILFFRHSSCSSTGAAMSFTGNSGSTVVGAIYSPSKALDVSGGTSIAGSCLQLIANTISFSGSGTIGSSCSGVGVKDILAGGKGVLVE